MSDKSGARKRSAAELCENEEEENASLREQLQQQEARCQQIEAQIQQLQQQDARLQQMEARNQHFQKTSIYALLKREKSGNKKEGLFTFKCQVDDTCHSTPISHRPASTDSMDFILEPVELTEDVKGKSSMLMLKLDQSGGVITYQNQTEISMYIKLALGDATTMVSLIKKIRFYVLHEQSIFSQRPDHVVVYDSESQLPIIAVQFQKPAHGGILSRNTAGELFDCAVSMQSLGHKAPFMVLSSLEETHVTWLDESLSRALAAGRGRVEAVSTNESSLSVERSANALDQVDDTPLPPDLIDGDPCSQELVFEADAERKFCRSTAEYNSSQLTRVLYSAILCGLQGFDRSSTKSMTRFTPLLAAGDSKRCLELSEDSYNWGTVSSNQKQPTRLEKLSKKKYYVVGVIGTGNTSKVFHAIDLDSKEYAIKMYMQRFDGDSDLTEEEFEEIGRQSVTTEVNHFNLIYSKLDVVCEKLNKRHCVIMPFFSPIPKDEREGYIEKIEKVLNVFASKNLKYKDGDVRWRHVGLYKGECILYDLAELEASTSNSFVPEHVEEFKRRADVFSYSTGQTF